MIWLRQLLCRHNFKLVKVEDVLWSSAVDGSFTAIDRGKRGDIHHRKYTTHCPKCDTWRIKKIKQH